MWTKNPQNRYTNKVMCVLCWRLKWTEGPSSLSLIMTIMKTIKSSTIFLSNTAFYIILLSLPRNPSYSGFLSKHCPLLFMYACYVPYAHYPPSTNYVNNNWCTITVMKLTTESSAALFSYTNLISGKLWHTLSEIL